LPDRITARRFDLDYIRAQIRQQAGAKWGRHEMPDL
jgi:hypothetical protein